MKRNSLFLFLSLMFVWAGLCSAQTTSDKYYLIDGYFFNGMPPGIRNAQGDRFVMLKDDEGHMALEIRLPKGKTLPEFFGKRFGQLCTWPAGAVHIFGVAKHNSFHPILPNDLLQTV